MVTIINPWSGAEICIDANRFDAEAIYNMLSESEKRILENSENLEIFLLRIGPIKAGMLTLGS